MYMYTTANFTRRLGSPPYDEREPLWATSGSPPIDLVCIYIYIYIPPIYPPSSISLIYILYIYISLIYIYIYTYIHTYPPSYNHMCI